MATRKSFTLNETPDSGGGGACAKLCICTAVLSLIGIIGVVGVYVYRVTYGDVCSSCELDESGLSNWTSGADRIAYACFPDYFLDGESNLVVAKCENGHWNPPPPACNYLPLRIDCQINNQSLSGNISMWQQDSNAPTHIYGFINYTHAVKPQGNLMEHIVLSKRVCNVSHVIPHNFSDFHHPEPKAENQTDEKLLKIQFESMHLKSYRMAEIYINMIFVNYKTASLVSVHQQNQTLVMTTSDPGLNSSWNLTDKGLNIFPKFKTPTM